MDGIGYRSAGVTAAQAVNCYADTYANIATLISTSTLKKGASYYITDKEITLTAESVNRLSLDGFYKDTSLSPTEVDFINYDFALDRITLRRDKRGNQVTFPSHVAFSFPTSPFDTFPWGNDNVYGNNFSGATLFFQNDLDPAAIMTYNVIKDGTLLLLGTISGDISGNHIACGGYVTLTGLESTFIDNDIHGSIVSADFTTGGNTGAIERMFLTGQANLTYASEATVWDGVITNLSSLNVSTGTADGILQRFTLEDVATVIITNPTTTISGFSVRDSSILTLTDISVSASQINILSGSAFSVASPGTSSSGTIFEVFLSGSSILSLTGGSTGQLSNVLLGSNSTMTIDANAQRQKDFRIHSRVFTLVETVAHTGLVIEGPASNHIQTLDFATNVTATVYQSATGTEDEYTGKYIFTTCSTTPGTSVINSFLNASGVYLLGAEIEIEVEATGGSTRHLRLTKTVPGSAASGDIIAPANVDLSGYATGVFDRVGLRVNLSSIFQEITYNRYV